MEKSSPLTAAPGIRHGIWLAALLFASALHGAEHEHGSPRGVLSLDVHAGATHLDVLTGESREGSEKPILRHTRSENGGMTWSQPVRVDEGMPPGFSLHRGMDAQIAGSGERLIAVWTTAGTDRWGSGPMATAISADGGRTWQAGPNPADDHSTTGHGFIDMAADGEGTFHLTWLDSRDGRQGLRYSRSSDHGRTWSPNSTLKAATCECCSNALATGPDGSVAILFRDGSPRDMGMALSRDRGGHWIAPVRAGDFGWEFNGCPHVGGGLALTPTSVHAAVWSGMAERIGVQYLASSNSGTTWSKPRQLGGETASHPDIAAGSDRRIAAVWDEQTDGKPGIWGASSSDGGTTWAAAVRLSKSDAGASHPRVVATTNGFRAFWTEERPEARAAWASAVVP